MTIEEKRQRHREVARTCCEKSQELASLLRLNTMRIVSVEEDDGGGAS